MINLQTDINNSPKDKDFVKVVLNLSLVEDHFILFGYEGMRELLGELEGLKEDILIQWYDHQTRKRKPIIGNLKSPCKEENK